MKTPVASDEAWRGLLSAARGLLGRGDRDPEHSESWCAWTTFAALEHGVHYWACGFPEEDELLQSRTVDGGLWRQSFEYSDIAHLVIPAKFYWERLDAKAGFLQGYKTQDINSLSKRLVSAGIDHRLTDLVLELKVY